MVGTQKNTNPTTNHVISTEARDSLTVPRAVKSPLYSTVVLPWLLPVFNPYHPY
jgi:hypothetical protein